MRRSWVRNAVIAVAVLTIASACSSDSDTPDGGDLADVEVTYKVLSQEMDRTEITYTYNGGDDIYQGEEDLPFEKTFTMKVGDIIDLGAKTDGSTATCRVEINGKKYLESTESGGKFPVCQGRVPAPQDL